MITHEELDKLNKEPLKLEAHKLLEAAENCKHNRNVGFISGVVAALLGLMFFWILAQVGFMLVIRILFWVTVAALAVYGALKLWSDKKLGPKSQQAGRAVSQRLAVYGKRGQHSEPNKQEPPPGSSDQPKKSLATKFGFGFNHRGGEEK